MSADAWIEALDLRPHVEGGFYRETWAASEAVRAAGGPRPLANTIYYLLTAASPIGRFHRNPSAISHFFHAGGPIHHAMISPEGAWHEVTLGGDPGAGQVLRYTCPGGWWKSSWIAAGVDFGLCSELVAPGFDFADHELADAERFAALFPGLRRRWDGLVGETCPKEPVLWSLSDGT